MIGSFIYFLPCKRCLFNIVNFIDILFHKQCLHAFSCNLQQPITNGSNTPFSQHILSHDFHTQFVFYSTSFFFDLILLNESLYTVHTPPQILQYRRNSMTKTSFMCMFHSMRVQFFLFILLTLLETKI